MPNEQKTDAQNLADAVSYVKTVLGITGNDQDIILGIYIQSAVSKIYELTGIDLLQLGAVEKKFDGAGQNILFLPNFVAELEKVQYNANKRGTPEWTDFETNSYVLKEDGQLVFKNSLPRGYANILVEFKYNFSDFASIPRSLADLKLALALLVGNIQATQETTGYSSESVSGTSITFDKTTMTSNVITLIDKYKVFAL